MQKYQDVVDIIGPPGLMPITGANVTVYLRGTSTQAAIYSDNSSTVAGNPLTTDSSGRYSFYAADGRYDLKVSGAGIQTTTLTDVVLSDTGPALAASSGSSLVGFIQNGMGAVVRTVQTELKDIYKAQQFGAVADGNGIGGGTDNTTFIQAAHDAIVATGKPGVLLIAPGIYRVDGALNWNATYVHLSAFGVTFDFKNKTTGTALAITNGAPQLDFSGLKMTGNANNGSVVGISLSGVSLPTTARDIKLRNLIVQTFGIDLQIGSYCFDIELDNCRLRDATINIDYQGSLQSGENIRIVGGMIENSIPGGKFINFGAASNNADIKVWSTSFDGGGSFPIVASAGSGNRIKLIDCHVEASDFLQTIVSVSGLTSNFTMIGGEIISNQATITAANFLTIDGTVQNFTGGALFDDVYMGFGNTASGNFAGGVGALNCVIRNPRGGPVPFALSSATNLKPNIHQSGNGTWVPVLAGATTPGVQTYSTQVGSYTKIDDLVFAHFRIVLSAKDAAMAGAVQIKGLPFTAGGTANTQFSATIGAWQNINITGYVAITGLINVGDNFVSLIANAVNGALINVDSASISATSLITGTIIYKVTGP